MIASIRASKATEISKLFANNISARKQRKNSRKVIESVANIKLGKIKVVRIVNRTLKSILNKLTNSIVLSIRKAFKYVLINKAILPSNTEIGKISAIYSKLSAYLGSQIINAVLSGKNNNKNPSKTGINKFLEMNLKLVLSR